MTRFLPTLPLLAFLLLACGCNDASSTLVTDNGNLISTDEHLAELEREIRSLTDPPTATDQRQCQVIAFGVKPCGGPKTYLIYSTAKTDENRLRSLISEYNRLDAERNERLDLVSDCMLVVPHNVTLAGGQCIAATSQ